MSIRTLRFQAALRLSVLAFVGWTASGLRAEDLADNLSNPTAGTETATPQRWLAAAFRTEASATYRLSSVTLLLGNPDPGAAALDLHSDGDLEPGTRLATLTSPERFSDTPAATTFAAEGIPLDSSATYWVVLRPLSGTFDWTWTANNNGSGPGFDPTWDLSEDAGTSWYTHAVYPLQLRVTVATTVPIADCNENGVDDDVDLARGSSADANTNGILDECEPAFLRGDGNGDGAVNVSDASFSLEWLFGRAFEPPCLAALDTNGDGAVNVADPVFLLNFLFGGGPDITDPFPDCGIAGAPADVDLGCASPPPDCH